MYQMDDVFFILNLENKKLKYINILAWFYAIFDVKIAWKRHIGALDHFGQNTCWPYVCGIT